jgi:uncharacterized protein YodC (DUF2158 family)
MENEIKPGDVVTLKSGGPEMTVERTSDGGIGLQAVIECSWFAGGQLKRNTFSKGALAIVKQTQFRKAEVKPQ